MPPPPASVVEDNIARSQQLAQSIVEQALIERVQPYLTLNDGNKVPMLGLGTWSAQGKECKEALKGAIRVGYRHIDTASNYRNEDAVGEAIQECIQEGLVKREDLFVTTKLWNNSHSRASVPVALKRSLTLLNLDYVDLYLIHYPIGFRECGEWNPLDEDGKVVTSDVDYVETWRGMEDVQRLGLARSVGVSNFNTEQIARILYHCSVVPAMNQIELHPYLTQPRLVAYCRTHNIALTAYSPLGSPARLDPTAAVQGPRLLDDPLIKSLAKKYQRPAAQILLRFQLQRGMVVIPKAIQMAHIESNLNTLDFELSQDDLAQMEALNRNHRFQRFERCMNHKYYPFNGIDC